MISMMSFFSSVLPRRRRGGPGSHRRRRTALSAGIAVYLVVVTDIDQVFVALGRRRQGRHADVVGAAVPSPAEYLLALRARCAVEVVDRGHTAGECGRRSEGRGDDRHVVAGRRKGPGSDNAAAGRYHQHVLFTRQRPPQHGQADTHPATTAIGIARTQQAAFLPVALHGPRSCFDPLPDRLAARRAPRQVIDHFVHGGRYDVASADPGEVTLHHCPCPEVLS